MALQAMQLTDSTLMDRIDYRLETSATVRKYDIHVKVDAGTATLTGDVATAAQKATAGKLAAVDGVTKVQNDITVDPKADESVADRAKKGLNKAGEAITDSWINTKVHWFFIGEDLLKGSDINVDVKDGAVTLKGTVKSAAGRARAVQLANDTDGVKSVNNQLVVK
jgi:osmotically-inducible protein OsmY